MPKSKCPTCGKENPTSYHIVKCELDKVKAEKAAGSTESKPEPKQEPKKESEPKTVRVKARTISIQEDNKVICDSCENVIAGQPKFCPSCGVELEW